MSAHGRHYRKGDPEYGPVCPRCAGPKDDQAGMCRGCYTDARRRLEYPLPPVPDRTAALKADRSGERARPQPTAHPWRKRWLLRDAQTAGSTT